MFLYLIYPRVLRDYTSPNICLDDPLVFRDLSKPMGALEPDRLRQFVERYEDWKADAGSLQVKTRLDYGSYLYSN